MVEVKKTQDVLTNPEVKENKENLKKDLEKIKKLAQERFKDKTYLNEKDIKNFAKELYKNEEEALKGLLGINLSLKEFDKLYDLYNKLDKDGFKEFMKELKETNFGMDIYETGFGTKYNFGTARYKFERKYGYGIDYFNLQSKITGLDSKTIIDIMETIKYLNQNWINIKDYINAKQFLDKGKVNEDNLWEFISDLNNNGIVEGSDNGIISGPSVLKNFDYWEKQIDARSDFSQKYFWNTINTLIRFGDNTGKFGNLSVNSKKEFLSYLKQNPELKFILINGMSKFESMGGNLFHLFENKGDIKVLFKDIKNYKEYIDKLLNSEKIKDLEKKIDEELERKLIEKIFNAKDPYIKELLNQMLENKKSIIDSLMPDFIGALISNVETRRGVGIGVSWNLIEKEWKSIVSNVHVDLGFARVNGNILPGIGIGVSNVKSLNKDLDISLDFGIFNIIPYVGAGLDYKLNRKDLEEIGFFDFNKEDNEFVKSINGKIGVSTLGWGLMVGYDKDKLKAIEVKIKQLDDILTKILDGKKVNISKYCEYCDDKQKNSLEKSINLLTKRINETLKELGYSNINEVDTLLKNQIKSFYINKFKEYYLNNAKGTYFGGLDVGMAFVAGFLPLPVIGVKWKKLDIKYQKDPNDILKDSINLIDNNFDIVKLKTQVIDVDSLLNKFYFTDGNINYNKLYNDLNKKNKTSSNAFEKFLGLTGINVKYEKYKGNEVLVIETNDSKSILEKLNIFYGGNANFKVEGNKLYIGGGKLNYYLHIDEKGNKIPYLFLDVEDIGKAKRVVRDTDKLKIKEVIKKQETKINVIEKIKENNDISEGLLNAFHEKFSPDKNIDNYIKLAMLNFKKSTRKLFEDFNNLMIDISSSGENVNNKLDEAKELLYKLLKTGLGDKFLDDLFYQGLSLNDIFENWKDLSIKEKFAILNTFSNITRTAINIVEVFEDKDWFNSRGKEKVNVGGLLVKKLNKKFNVADIPNWDRRKKVAIELFKKELDLNGIDKIIEDYDNFLNLKNKDKYTTNSLNNVIALITDYHISPKGKGYKKGLEIAGPGSITTIEDTVFYLNDLNNKQKEKIVNVLYEKGKVYFDNMLSSLKQSGINITEKQFKQLLIEGKLSLDNGNKNIILDRQFIFFREGYGLDESIGLKIDGLKVITKSKEYKFDLEVGTDGSVSIMNPDGKQIVISGGVVTGDRKDDGKKGSYTRPEDRDEPINNEEPPLTDGNKDSYTRPEDRNNSINNNNPSNTPDNEF